MKRVTKFIAAMLLSFGSIAFCETSIDDVFYSITSHKVTAGDFVQEKSSPNLKRPLKSSGKFVFSQEGIVWQTLKPFPTTMAVTGDSLIQINMKGEKTVTDGSSNEVFKSVAATLSSLFSGSRAELEKHFTVKSFTVENSLWKMALAPKDKTIASALSEIVLSGTAAEKNSALTGMIVSQNSGSNSNENTTKYELLNQVYREGLSDEEKNLLKK